MNLKPFDLEKALAGEPVITRDGRKVSELYYFKTISEKDNYRICVVIDKTPFWVNEKGRFKLIEESSYDLFMASRQVTKWVNVYSAPFRTSTYFFETEEDAKGWSGEKDYITTVPITFEI